MGLQVRLAGPLSVSAGGRTIGAADFPGRQGRIVFAALALARRPVDRNELAEMLWPNRLPASWTRDLSAIVSKLRALLADDAAIATAGGRWYGLELPPDSVVDVDAAIAAVERAERVGAAALDEQLEQALGVLTRSFLEGDDCPWIDERRAVLRAVLARGLARRAQLLLERGAPTAIAAARELVDLEPARESSHVLLMQAQLAAGSRVEALRTYERLRRLLADDFGLSPSPEAEALLHEALGPAEPPAVPRRVAELPASVVDARRAVMVGRSAELHEIDQRLVPVTGTRLVAVVGPAGIGKSRLACEVAARAHADDELVLFGACTDGPAAPYRVVIDAFDAYRATPGIAPHHARLAGAVVDLLAARDAAPAAGGGASTDVRSATAGVLRELGGSGRVLFVVDDLQWADTASIRLLEHLIGSVTALRVVVTLRSGTFEHTHVGAMVSRERTRDRAAFVRLGGLTASEVALALREHGAGDIGIALLHEVHRTTAGNPLFVREIGRHLARSHADAAPPTGLFAGGAPPGDLTELIDANVDRLGPGTREVLEVAAVIGGTIDPEILATASDLTPAELDAAVAAARRAGILVSASDATTLRFEHPLVREVLLHGLSPAARARRHERVATAIETSHRHELERFSVELAHHLSAAANVGRADDAIEFARRAGARATSVSAHDEAVQWYSHALRIARDRNDGPDTIAPILGALGAAQNHSGDAATARATLLDAVAVARTAAQPERFAEAVLQLGGVLVDDGSEGGAVDGCLCALLEEAIAQPGLEPARRACLMVRLAQELHFAGDRARCTALCAEAESLVSERDDPETMTTVLAGHHYALYGAPALDERTQLLARIQRLTTHVRPDPRWMRDYLELGDIAAVEAAAAHFEHQLERAGVASDRYYPAVLRSTLAAMRGDLAFAEAAADAAAEVGRASARGPAAVAAVWAAQIFAVRLFDGRLAELRDAVDGAADDAPERPIWRSAAAFLHLELGDRDRATEHLQALRAGGFGRLPDSLDRPMTLALLAWVVADIGTRADARELRGLLRPYRPFLVVLGAAAPYVCAGPVAYPLAMLEARLGNESVAARLLASAATQAEAVGARPWSERIARARATLAPAAAPA